MKRILAVLMSALLLLSVSACGGNTDNSEPTPTPASNTSVQTAVSQEVFETPVETNELLGKWVNEENSVSIEFFDDGTYVNDSIEGTYTHEDNTLTLTYGGGAVVEEYSAGLRDGQLVLVRDDFQIILDKAE